MARRQLIAVIDKMIVRDLVKTLIAVLTTIVVIIVSQQFISVLSKAIEGKVASQTILNILGLKLIAAAIAFLPVSLFVAILIVLGRMYRDQEMSAIAVAGSGIGRIYRAAFLLALPMSVLVTGMAAFVSPWTEAMVGKMVFDDNQTMEMRGVAAGRFSEFQNGELVFYVEDINTENVLQQVFVRDQRFGELGITTAESGEFKILTGGRYLLLYNGERIQGRPGQVDYVIETFSEYAVRLEATGKEVNLDLQAVPSQQLWSSNELVDKAELQRRFSIPISVIILCALAIPLAQISPRGGVYGNMLTAFLVYFGYANILKLSESWVRNAQLPEWLGFNLIYGLMLLIIGGLLMRLYGWEWIKLNLRRQVKQ